MVLHHLLLRGAPFPYSFRFVGSDNSPQPAEGSVERDLDRVRPGVEQLCDLERSQVGPVAERDQLAVALVEGSQGA